MKPVWLGSEKITDTPFCFRHKENSGPSKVIAVGGAEMMSVAAGTSLSSPPLNTSVSTTASARKKRVLKPKYVTLLYS